MGRIERDILELKRDMGEIKSDNILMENRLLNRIQEILDLDRRVENHERRLETLESPA